MSGSHKTLSYDEVTAEDESLEEAFNRYAVTLTRVKYDQLEYIVNDDGSSIELGCGSVGQVLRGRYLDQEVAIKLYKDRADLRDELNAMTRFKASNYILRAISFCVRPPCLVTEYMPKGSLEDLLYKEEKLDVKTSIRIAYEVTCGVEEIHAQDWIHRDVKAGNVLIDDNYHAKLADFDTAIEKKKVNKANVVETPSWGAPEVTQQKKKHISDKSDIYGLGKVFTFLARGRKAFYEAFSVGETSENMQNIIKDIEKDRKYSPRFTRLIGKCVQYSPYARPAAKEVLKELEEELKELENTNNTAPKPV